MRPVAWRVPRDLCATTVRSTPLKPRAPQHLPAVRVLRQQGRQNQRRANQAASRPTTLKCSRKRERPPAWRVPRGLFAQSVLSTPLPPRAPQVTPAVWALRRWEGIPHRRCANQATSQQTALERSRKRERPPAWRAPRGLCAQSVLTTPKPPRAPQNTPVVGVLRRWEGQTNQRCATKAASQPTAMESPRKRVRPAAHRVPRGLCATTVRSTPLPPCAPQQKPAVWVLRQQGRQTRRCANQATSQPTALEPCSRKRVRSAAWCVPRDLYATSVRSTPLPLSSSLVVSPMLELLVKRMSRHAPKGASS